MTSGQTNNEIISTGLCFRWISNQNSIFKHFFLMCIKNIWSQDGKGQLQRKNSKYLNKFRCPRPVDIIEKNERKNWNLSIKWIFNCFMVLWSEVFITKWCYFYKKMVACVWCRNMMLIGRPQSLCSIEILIVFGIFGPAVQPEVPNK